MQVCCYTLFYSWGTTSGLLNWWRLFLFRVVEPCPGLPGEPGSKLSDAKSCVHWGLLIRDGFCPVFPTSVQFITLPRGQSKHRSYIYQGLRALYLGSFYSVVWESSHCGFCPSNGLRWQTDGRGNLQRSFTLFLVPLGKIQWRRWDIQGHWTSKEPLQKSAKSRLVQKFLIPLNFLWSEK